MSNDEVKQRTDFLDLSATLWYIFVVCIGDATVMLKQETMLIYGLKDVSYILKEEYIDQTLASLSSLLYKSQSLLYKSQWMFGSLQPNNANTVRGAILIKVNATFCLYQPQDIPMLFII